MEEGKKIEFNGSPLETEEKVLFVWKADGRLYKKRGKDFYSTVVVLALLVSVIMFFIEGLMPVFLIWAVVFVMWALSRTPPVEVEHKLTNWGLRTENDLFSYAEMQQYWFEEKWGKMMMRILLRRRFPGQVVVIVNKGDEDKLKKIMGEQVVLQRPTPGFTDKAVKWLGEKLPLEEEVK